MTMAGARVERHSSRERFAGAGVARGRQRASDASERAANWRACQVEHNAASVACTSGCVTCIVRSGLQLSLPRSWMRVEALRNRCIPKPRSWRADNHDFSAVRVQQCALELHSVRSTWIQCRLRMLHQCQV